MSQGDLPGLIAGIQRLLNKGLIEQGLIFDRRERNLVRADWATVG
jgi:hypothetical protein